MSRIRAFALALLALCGLTAFMAAGAQANWLENGVEVTENKNVLAKAHTTGELSVPGLNIEFRCTTLAAAGLKILGKSSTAEGEVSFSGCSAFSPANLAGTIQPECKPAEPIVAGGRALIKLLAKTKGGVLNNYILFEPKPEKPFTKLVLPEKCALAESANVTGSLVAECGILVENKETKKFVFSSEDCKEARVEHLLQAGPTVWFESDGKGGHVEVKDILKYGANVSTLGGIAAVELESKKSWAGHV